MPEQHLNLLQLPSCRPAQLRASPPAIVRRYSGNAGGLAVRVDELPNQFPVERNVPNVATAIHRSEEGVVCNRGSRGPRIYRHLDPSRHSQGADSAMFADQINDAPTAISLLAMAERKRRALSLPYGHYLGTAGTSREI